MRVFYGILPRIQEIQHHIRQYRKVHSNLNGRKQERIPEIRIRSGIRLDDRPVYASEYQKISKSPVNFRLLSLRQRKQLDELLQKTASTPHNQRADRLSL